MTVTATQSALGESPPMGKPDELRRIARLIQFARSSAMDAGEVSLSARLSEIERQVEQTIAERVAEIERLSAPKVIAKTTRPPKERAPDELWRRRGS